MTPPRPSTILALLLLCAAALPAPAWAQEPATPAAQPPDEGAAERDARAREKARVADEQEAEVEPPDEAPTEAEPGLTPEEVRARLQELPPVATTCTQVTAVGVNVRLVLRGAEWDGWEEMCDRLVDYLRTGTPPLPPETAEGARRLLEQTGYFRFTDCRSTEDALVCETAPRRMVYDLDIRGDVPWGILEDDLARRVFLKPGALLEEERTTLARQRKRLEDYMRREGYFGSVVRLETEQVDAARPNQGVRLTASLRPGRTVVLEDIDVRGQLPPEYPREELERWLRHYWLLWWFEARFRPVQFEEDLLAVSRQLQRLGYPEARVTGDWALDLSRGRADVIIQVEAGPKLALGFEGNEALSDKALEKLATFEGAGVVDQVEIEDTGESIRTRYQEKGFYEVDVSGVAEPTDDDRVLEVTYTIDEGPRAKIVEVVFEGHESWTAEAIEDNTELLTGESGFLSAGRWVDPWVQADQRAIEAFYEDRGYAAASVEARREEVADGELRVTFAIDEGPRRMVRSMTWEGLPEEIDEEALLERLDLKTSTPYVHGSLGTDRQEILTTLAAHGYARAVVKRDLDKPPPSVGGPVTIHYRILPGPKSLFGGVLVRGNFRTVRGLVEEQLQLDPGDPLDLVALGQARRSLRGLGPFLSVDLEPLGLWREDPETWLLVALQERNTRYLDVLLSAGTDDGFGVGFEYGDRNIFGRAMRLDARVRTGTFADVLPFRIGNTDLADVTLRAPTPFGTPFDVEGTLFYRYQDKTDFTEQRLGGGLGLVRRLLSRDDCELCPSITARLRYELTSGYYEDRTARFVLFERSYGFPQANIGRIAPSLHFEDRDSFVDPRRGWAGDLRFEYANDFLAPLTEGANFWRFVGSGQGYLNLGTPYSRVLPGERVLGGPVVLAFGASWGAARPYGESIRVPDTETFWYGGDYSVRGLEDRASRAGYPGANYQLVGNFELRWYVLQRFIAGDLQLAGFVDVGGASYNFTDVLDDPTISVGPALRFVTPVGPISIAYGIAVRPSEAVQLGSDTAIPRGGRFHLTLGYPF